MPGALHRLAASRGRDLTGHVIGSVQEQLVVVIGDSLGSRSQLENCGASSQDVYLSSKETALPYCPLPCCCGICFLTHLLPEGLVVGQGFVELCKSLVQAVFQDSDLR